MSNYFLVLIKVPISRPSFLIFMEVIRRPIIFFFFMYTKERNFTRCLLQLYLTLHF